MALNMEILRERLREAFGADPQETVGKKLNMTQGNVSKLLSGSQHPTLETVFHIAEAYGVSVDWLLGVSDQREIDGVSPEKLTYEQVARMLDRLIETGTVTVPDLQKLRDSAPAGGPSPGPDGAGSSPPREPDFNPDYIKVNDRVLSYLLRRRFLIYKVGEDMAELWKAQSLPNFRGVRLLNYTGNTQDAVDTWSWSTFRDGDWVEMIQTLSAMNEEERAALIEKSKKRERDGDGNG